MKHPGLVPVAALLILGASSSAHADFPIFNSRHLPNIPFINEKPVPYPLSKNEVQLRECPMILAEIIVPPEGILVEKTPGDLPSINAHNAAMADRIKTEKAAEKAAKKSSENKAENKPKDEKEYTKLKVSLPEKSHQNFFFGKDSLSHRALTIDGEAEVAALLEEKVLLRSKNNYALAAALLHTELGWHVLQLKADDSQASRTEFVKAWEKFQNQYKQMTGTMVGPAGKLEPEASYFGLSEKEFRTVFIEIAKNPFIVELMKRGPLRARDGFAHIAGNTRLASHPYLPAYVHYKFVAPKSKENKALLKFIEAELQLVDKAALKRLSKALAVSTKSEVAKNELKRLTHPELKPGEQKEAVVDEKAAPAPKADAPPEPESAEVQKLKRGIESMKKFAELNGLGADGKLDVKHMEGLQPRLIDRIRTIIRAKSALLLPGHPEGTAVLEHMLFSEKRLVSSLKAIFAMTRGMRTEAKAQIDITMKDLERSFEDEIKPKNKPFYDLLVSEKFQKSFLQLVGEITKDAEVGRLVAKLSHTGFPVEPLLWNSVALSLQNAKPDTAPALFTPIEVEGMRVVMQYSDLAPGTKVLELYADGIAGLDMLSRSHGNKVVGVDFGMGEFVETNPGMDLVQGNPLANITMGIVEGKGPFQTVYAFEGFQKAHFDHGDVTPDDYLKWLNSTLSDGGTVVLVNSKGIEPAFDVKALEVAGFDVVRWKTERELSQDEKKASDEWSEVFEMPKTEGKYWVYVFRKGNFKGNLPEIR